MTAAAVPTAAPATPSAAAPTQPAPAAPWKIGEEQAKELASLASRAALTKNAWDSLLARHSGGKTVLSEVDEPSYRRFRDALLAMQPEPRKEVGAKKPEPAAAPAPAPEKKKAAARSRASVEASLSEPLAREDIRQRRGPGGVALDYLKIGDVVLEANDIFGSLDWESGVKELVLLGSDQGVTQGGAPAWTARAYALVRVSVSIDGRPANGHEDAGFCSSMPNPDRGAAEEFALKGAVSDGVKRCLSFWGNRLGLALKFDQRERLDEGMVASEGSRPGDHAPARTTTAPATTSPAPAATLNAGSSPSSAPRPDPKASIRDVVEAVSKVADGAPISIALANSLVGAAKKFGKNGLEVMRKVGVAPPSPPSGAQARAFLAALDAAA